LGAVKSRAALFLGRGLRQELSVLQDAVFIGECATRGEAIAAIVEQRPDVVFLDVRLGRTNAFEIIEEIGVDSMPIVFSSLHMNDIR
jgi:two-component system, LytTR family, response regulator